MVDCLKYFVSDFMSSSLAFPTRTIPVFYGPVGKVASTLAFKIWTDVSTMLDIDMETCTCSLSYKSELFIYAQFEWFIGASDIPF